MSAEEDFRGIVAEKVSAEDREGVIVIIGVYFCGRVDEAAAECLQGEAGGERKAGVEGGEFG